MAKTKLQRLKQIKSIRKRRSERRARKNKLIQALSSPLPGEKSYEEQRQSWLSYTPDASRPLPEDGIELAPVSKETKRAASQQGNAFYRFYRRYLHNFLGIAFMTAFLITLITETQARKTAFGGVAFLLQHPLVFLCNVLIVFATVSLALMFRHRLFFFSVFSIFWLAMGIVNGIILGQRMTPFTTYDLAELEDGLTLVSNYFTTKQLRMLIGGGILLVLILLFLFMKLPKQRGRVHKIRAFFTCVVIVGFSLGSIWGATQVGILDTYFGSLPTGYEDNGFNYSFLITWLDKGISKPSNYSAESITSIFTEEELNTTVPGRTTLSEEDEEVSTPNIIFVQLESFIDPLTVEGITCSEDPIPNFRALMENYSSGRLTVPAIGAGTANTEFEVMSGMSVKFFGTGEYPYKTILLEETCETVAYDLKAYGYTAHAIHNHRGAFYGRNKVYPNLGYETFTCLEYMIGVTKTPKNWAKDDVLTEQILNALDSTEGSDYIFTISVQGHGKYPTEQLLEDPTITITEAPDEELKWQWEYYVNQLADMDAFVGELVAAVDAMEEDTIIVFYGDHIPAISNITDETLKDGRTAYQTDYVVYSNFDLEEIDQDLYAYQLSAAVLDQLDIHNGTLVTFHQNHSDDENYLEELEALQYDMLYGNKYIYNGTSPFVATNLQMGVNEIKITSIVQIGDKYYIQGENFTSYSKVNLDGSILDTTYISSTLLELEEEVDPSAVVRMKVSQVEKKKEILSTTE